MRTIAALLVVASGLVLPSLAVGARPGPLLASIKAVGKEGAANVETAQALQELVQLGPEVLPDILIAFDDADPVAANWLRAAVDTIAEREVNANRPLPAVKLEAFVKDIRHNGAARRIAYRWLLRVDAEAPKRLLPGMLDDPGQELRRAAVAVAFAAAQNHPEKKSAAAALQRVFAAARDNDQVEQIAQKLAALGIHVDLPAHFGFVRQWQMVGPFDNRGGQGFSVVYTPEERVDLSATYVAKDGARIGWKTFATANRPGHVDLGKLAKVDVNTVIGKHLDAVAYAFAAIESPQEQAVEVRAATPNALKLFLNGKEILAREEYHRNGRLDTHIGRGLLRAGRNELLVKVCQNEQPDAWAQEWAFQVRICDAIGGAVPLKVRPEEVGTRLLTSANHNHWNSSDRSAAHRRWWLSGGLIVAVLVAVWMWRRSRRDWYAQQQSLVVPVAGLPQTSS